MDKEKTFIVQLNSWPVRRIELFTKVCTVIFFALLKKLLDELKV